MHKLFLTLVATVFVSSVAVVSEAAPPVAEGAIPSGYVWLSGGTVAGAGVFRHDRSSGPVGQWASGPVGRAGAGSVASNNCLAHLRPIRP